MQSSFGSYKIVAFISTARPAEARVFYRDRLGLAVVSDNELAIVFDANGTMLRVTIVDKVLPAAYTVLGWEVPSIDRAVEELSAGGVRLERFAGMDQDERGVWTAPSGAQIAWFKDPDGNILSISQF